MKNILAIIISLFATICIYAQTGNAEVDSLTDLALQHYSTPQGIYYAERLSEAAKRNGVTNRIYSGYNLKCGSYINMGLNDLAIEYVDSIIHNTDIYKDNFKCYTNLTSYVSKAYCNLKKYRLAVQIAMQMYDESRDYINEKPIDNGDGTYTIPDNLNERIIALQCMAHAYNEMENADEGTKVEYEILELTKDYPLAFFNDRLDACTGIIVLSSNQEDKGIALNNIKNAHESLNLLKNLSEDNTIDINEFTIYDMMVYFGYFDAYAKMKDLNNATQYFALIKATYEKTDDEYASYIFYNACATYYYLIGDNELAITYADSMLMRSSQEVTPRKTMLLLKLNANHKAKLYDFDYDIAMQLLNESDRLANEKMASAADEMTTMLGMDRLKLEKQQLENRQTKMILITIFIIISSLFAIALLSLRMKHKKAKEKQRILAEQKELLEKEVARQTSELRYKNALIEKKNRDITDSINYAQQIQNSILTDFSQFKGHGIEDAFVLFRPCNIVSGDFYWAKSNGDNIIFACADCTGHGVPGAFMSMIGATLLNEICCQPTLPSASHILEQLDDKVITTLNNNGSELQDGMDISLVVFNRVTRNASIAAARRPVCLYHNNEQTFFKGAKRSIGDRDDKIRKTTFEEYNVTIEQGDIIYMYSDGICDQFGGQTTYGKAGKRLMNTGLSSMIGKVAKLDFQLQNDMFESLYNEWRGTCEQLDDISLIGIKF
ncbi:MAG: SpoIIE family protein phosphatase [Bacteroidales bacterium]|nr:SpoIIE family protein phosphatase [Bacteroidales bacterium]